MCQVGHGTIIVVQSITQIKHDLHVQFFLLVPQDFLQIFRITYAQPTIITTLNRSISIYVHIQGNEWVIERIEHPQLGLRNVVKSECSIGLGHT